MKPLVFSLADLAYVDEVCVTKNFQNPHDHAVYKATEVDAAIAELKQKLHDAEMAKDDAECANTEYRIDIEKLKAKFNPLYEELKRVKDENDLLKKRIANGDVSRMGWIDEVLELKAENERIRKIAMGNVEELRKAHEKELHSTRRALWLARAERANARKDYWYARSCHEGDKRLWSIDGSPVKYIGCIKRTNFDWLKIWSEVECKCLKKAEEYK